MFHPPYASRPLVALVVFLLSALSSQGASTAATRAPSSHPAAALQLRPHRFAPEAHPAVDGEVGTLTVLENRDKQGGKTIRISFVRLPATVVKPGPPIVYLAGGPGSPGSESARDARWPFFDALRQVGDVILLDQRGTGRSRPNLICRESWSFPPGEPLELLQLLAIIRDQARTCATRLRQEGIDLTAYNAREIAGDLEDLRIALGAERLRLFATSFGTYLALTCLRLYPNSIDRLVLAGVVGPGQTAKLPGIVSDRLPAVQALAGVETSAARQDLATLIRKVLAELGSFPRTLTVHDGMAQREVKVVAGRLDVQLATLPYLSDRGHLAELMHLYRSLDQGDFSPLEQALLRGKRGWLGRTLPYTVICSAGLSVQRRERIENKAEEGPFGRLLDFPFPEICPSWRLPEPEAELATPVHSHVPVLLISGTLDMRTPLENAQEVLDGLPNGIHLVLEGAGHGDDLLLSSPRIPGMVAAFFSGESVKSERIAVAPTSESRQ